jgi:DGQHR domain-containing protein
LPLADWLGSWTANIESGLTAFNGETFDVPVTIFVGADISDQAHIFATVNLEQTKVNKSLVYDLFSLARTRSPQKSCHNIAVALDRDEKSAFYRRIKRLGFATEGRIFEPITQATFVEALMPYISSAPKKDRDLLLREESLQKVYGDELFKLPFRNLFIDKQDLLITEIISNYFDAVRTRWPDAWDESGRGMMLNRTNGFRALMRFLSMHICMLQHQAKYRLHKNFWREYLRISPWKAATLLLKIFHLGQAAKRDCTAFFAAKRFSDSIEAYDVTTEMLFDLE